MSTSGISSSLAQLEAMMTDTKQFLTDFQKLGTDLKSGNLSASQQDFVTLSKDAQTSAAATPSAFSSSSTQGQSALDTDFKTLSQDLKSGDLSGAQKAFTQAVKDMQSSTSSTANSDSLNVLAQLLQTLFGLSSSSSSSTSGTTSSGTSSSTSTSTDASSSAVSSSASSSGSSDALANLTQEFAAIGAALQSGDLAGAQNAFAQFTAEAQSAGSTVGALGVQHHPHAQNSAAGDGAQLLQAFLSSQSASSNSTNSTTASGSTLNVSA